jgi:hypothetical protein
MLKFNSTITRSTQAHQMVIFGFFGLSVIHSNIYGNKYVLLIRIGHAEAQIGFGFHEYTLGTENRNATGN